MIALSAGEQNIFATERLLHPDYSAEPKRIKEVVGILILEGQTVKGILLFFKYVVCRGKISNYSKYHEFF